jgi:hypothetical protein
MEVDFEKRGPRTYRTGYHRETTQLIRPAPAINPQQRAIVLYPILTPKGDEDWRAAELFRSRLGHWKTTKKPKLMSAQALEEFLLKYPDTIIHGNPYDAGRSAGWSPKNKSLATLLYERKKEQKL